MPPKTNCFVRALGAAVLLVSAGASAAPADTRLVLAIAGDQRTPAFAERDRFRHPAETLTFFGIQPDQTVVEVWPGGGWYTEILAPYLRDEGQLILAGFVLDAPNTPGYRVRIQGRLMDKLNAQPEVYDRVEMSELGAPDSWAIAPPGSVDLVLTFRNVHNWIGEGTQARMFQAFYDALKPGGTLGVVEHRAPSGADLETMKRSGYVTEDYVIELATQAGFHLKAKSEINANPDDDADHPKGVWTLPPSLALGEQDRDAYLAIGESDRMTLRFIKPQAH